MEDRAQLNGAGLDHLPVGYLESFAAGEQHAVVFIDREHRVTGFNARAAATSAALLGSPLTLGADMRAWVTTPEGHANYSRAWSGEAFSFRWQVPDPSGTTHTSLVQFTPVFENGVQTGLAISAVDVTPIESMREREEVNRNRLLRLVESTCDILRVEDHDGRVLFVSPSAQTILGYSRSEIVGKLWSDFVHPDDRDELVASRRRAYESGENFRHEQRVKRADGAWVHLECLGAPITNPGSEPMLAVSSREVSQRVTAERDLRTARDRALEGARLKSEFLANVSHEIRTPMNAVIGMTTLLLETQLTEEQQQYTEIVRQSAESLLTLINNILDFSKAENGKLQLTNETVDLREVVEEVFQLLGESAARKGLELVTWADLDFPKFVSVDVDKMRRLLTNLVGNAVKFTQEGHVLVRLKLRKLSSQTWQAVVEVHDTGIGIDGQHHNQLFRAFSQVDGSATRKFGGTGLGLAICKQLVQAMGGRIGVESKEGQGSKFWFTFPLRRQALPSRSEPIDHPVLFVSAHPGLGVGVSRALWEEGFQHVSVVGIEQAVAASLDSTRCLLLDSAVGTDLIRLLVQRATEAEVPVVALVPFGGVAPVQGLAAQVRKPVRRSEIARVVKLALGLGETESSLLAADLSRASERLRKDYGPSEAAEVLELLVRDVVQLTSNAEAHVAAGEHDKAKQCALRLVSGCSSVGAERLQGLAQAFADSLERADDQQTAVRTLREFRDAFERAVGRISEADLAA